MPAAANDDRAAVARAIHKIVTQKLTTDQVLDRIPTPLGREMLFGSLRYYYSLDAVVNAQLKRALRKKDHDLWCLMLVGAYQLTHTRIPDHAAIHATVQACHALGKPWAKGLLNGVLRNLQRAPEQSFEASAHYPAWIVKLLVQDYSDASMAILTACQQRAPQTLRVNAARVEPADYQQKLAESGIDSSPGLVTAQLILDHPVATDELPGFRQGLVTVQDAGAGFAPQLLNLQPKQRLLDACAAPGGKLYHLLEAAGGTLQAVALENAPARVAHLRAESDRLGHRATIIEGDATTLEWWDGDFFDAVLVDAPCSGSGTLRRHPEMKLLRTLDDLPNYQKLQHALLQSTWQTLRPGGSLLYCTCSLFSAENDDVIDTFLASTHDARAQVITLPTGNATRSGWQLLPTDPRTDGFYYSLLTKTC